MQEICAVEDISETGRAVAVEVGGKRQPILLVRTGDTVHAYINDCPHVHWQLSFAEDGFYDGASGIITCRNHGAKYHGDTGHCVSGPCDGKHLTPFTVQVVDGKVACET